MGGGGRRSAAHTVVARTPLTTPGAPHLHTCLGGVWRDVGGCTVCAVCAMGGGAHRSLTFGRLADRKMVQNRSLWELENTHLLPKQRCMGCYSKHTPDDTDCGDFLHMFRQPCLQSLENSSLCTVRIDLGVRMLWLVASAQTLCTHE